MKNQGMNDLLNCSGGTGGGGGTGARFTRTARTVQQTATRPAQ